MERNLAKRINTYRDAEIYISDIPKFTKKNSMDDTRRFLKHLGNPAGNCKIIHIAGTNGKGSVCAYLCSVLKEAGISAGMFISPHLVEMRERLAADGRIATEQEFMEAFAFVMEKLSDLPSELAQKSYHPSFFEFLFFMAMVFFGRAGVEYVVLETGLGGRLDATNAVSDKKLCILTSIGYDHMEYLGDTLPQIAGEKAGIMRAGVPVVYPVRQNDVAEQIEKCARFAGAETVPVPAQAIKEIKIHHKTIDFSLHLNYYGYIGFTVSTSAGYQVENAALAVKALERLGDDRITVPVMQAGIRRMVWEGRMEEILPSVFLDGAHNIDGIRAFLDTVRLQPCRGRRKLLFSVVKDKQYENVIRELALSGLFNEIGLVALKDARALPLYALEDSYRQYTGFVCRTYDDLGTAFNRLALEKDDEDRVYIVGSLYLAGEIKALLRSLKHDQF
ncbi:MAG: bifunctional folylpolyglutamate synthase/dihydrofolate synthase [Lachnospiraceae bacterium]|nr:bifunctional folylpolyglutamate synthase/dihydrofolate synthase [Lachnospiraceae bacterium]